jgi:hypothetical protein
MIAIADDDNAQTPRMKIINDCMNLLDHGACGINDAIAPPLRIRDYVFCRSMGSNEQRLAPAVAKRIDLSNACSLYLAHNILIVNNIAQHFHPDALPGRVESCFNSPSYAETKTS